MSVEPALRSLRQQYAREGQFDMPRKIRELIRDLGRAGFINRGGKGSHRNYEHPTGIRVTLSGNPGDDAKPYQAKEIKRRIKYTVK